MKTQFNNYVSELVYFSSTKLNKSYKDISSELNVSESFVQKVHSYKYPQHYNLEHLYLLSANWGVNINEFLPSKNSIKNMNSKITEKEIEETLDSIKKELFERKKDYE